MIKTVYFAVGRCQHGKGGCHAAASFSQISTIVSPDFSTPDELEIWLTKIAEDASSRRCKACRRPIAIKHFVRRSTDSGRNIGEEL